MSEMNAIILSLMLIALRPMAARAQAAPSDAKVVTVDSVDLNRYVGKWYEIARLPNFFQKQCAMNTTATYTLLKDGDIEVVNKCTKSDGSVSVARGIAEVVDRKTDAKLKVSFVSILGIHLFWGDYWIIGLDKDYRYAVVGTPSRKFGWILSRTTSLTPSERQSVDDILKKNGYNPTDFIETEQTAR